MLWAHPRPPGQGLHYLLDLLGLLCLCEHTRKDRSSVRTSTEAQKSSGTALLSSRCWLADSKSPKLNTSHSLRLPSLCRPRSVAGARGSAQPLSPPVAVRCAGQDVFFYGVPYELFGKSAVFLCYFWKHFYMFNYLGAICFNKCQSSSTKRNVQVYVQCVG